MAKRTTKSKKCAKLRLVEDKDIDDILEAMGEADHIDQNAKQRLKDCINWAIKARNRSPKKSDTAPHKQIKRLEKIQQTAIWLREALHATGMEWELVLQCGYGSQRILPLSEAMDVVASSCRAVSNLEDWATAAKEKRMSEHKAKKRVAASQHPVMSALAADGNRYLFILRLAYIYERVFKVGTPATPDGPWYLFLTATLGRCESKELTDGGAHDLWLKVRKWKETLIGMEQAGRPFGWHQEWSLRDGIRCPDTLIEG
jgi:hypothetical protein